MSDGWNESLKGSFLKRERTGSSGAEGVNVLKNELLVLMLLSRWLVDGSGLFLDDH